MKKIIDEWGKWITRMAILFVLGIVWNTHNDVNDIKGDKKADTEWKKSMEGFREDAKADLKMLARELSEVKKATR